MTPEERARANRESMLRDMMGPQFLSLLMNARQHMKENDWGPRTLDVCNYLKDEVANEENQ